MSNQVINQVAELHETGAKDLHNWAPAVPHMIENYPNYWQLKGWICVVAADHAE